VIRKEARPFNIKIPGVRLCWELEKPRGPKGRLLQNTLAAVHARCHTLKVTLAAVHTESCTERTSPQSKNHCSVEMWSSSEEGSYSRLIDCCITRLESNNKEEEEEEDTLKGQM